MITSRMDQSLQAQNRIHSAIAESEKPLVSVIIPAYNQAQYLSFAIDSVLGQTFREFEVIVVDDGSTDDTPLVAMEFGDAIRYIRQENMGLSAARNTGIRLAQTEIIGLLDSDDCWEPEFLEEMLPILDNHPEAAAAYCGYRYMNTDGRIIGNPSLRVVPSELFHRTLNCEGNWLVPCAVIFRKQRAEEFGFFDESLRAAEDADLWTKMSYRYPFVGVSKILVRYRRHESNMTKDPERMVTANFQRTENMFGPPEGDVSSWSELKRCAYVKVFRFAVREYLDSGNITKGATYFQRLVEIEPGAGTSILTWRTIIRTRLPREDQGDLEQFDWQLAEQNVDQLLNEIAKNIDGSTFTKNHYVKIKGFAYLAFAEEAVQANNFSRAYSRLWKAARFSPHMLLTKPYWGTVVRGLVGLSKRSIP